jgi:N-glycosylase/DNA lyase
MKEKGYNINRSTLYRDRKDINQRNSFVRDLSESNYSTYVQEMFENIDFVTDEAMQMLTTTRNDRTKIFSGKLILEAVRTKTEILSGKVLDISVELLGKKLSSMREENHNLKEKLAKSRHDSHAN